jgi:hypothetical protein
MSRWRPPIPRGALLLTKKGNKMKYWDKKISELEKERDKLFNKSLNLKSSRKYTMGQLQLVEIQLENLSRIKNVLEYVNKERR